MREEVTNYLRKKGYRSTDASTIPYSVREIIKSETTAQKNAFLIGEGFWETDQGEPKALNLTDEEYSLIRAAFEQTNTHEKREENFSIYISAVKTLLPGDIINQIFKIFFDMAILALLGVVIGNYEYIADYYDPEFRMDVAVQFWCYSAMIMFCTTRIADYIRDIRWLGTKSSK